MLDRAGRTEKGQQELGLPRAVCSRRNRCWPGREWGKRTAQGGRPVCVCRSAAGSPAQPAAPGRELGGTSAAQPALTLPGPDREAERFSECECGVRVSGRNSSSEWWVSWRGDWQRCWLVTVLIGVVRWAGGSGWTGGHSSGQVHFSEHPLILLHRVVLSLSESCQGRKDPSIHRAPILLPGARRSCRERRRGQRRDVWGGGMGAVLCPQEPGSLLCCLEMSFR